DVNLQKKTERANISNELIKQAVDEVLEATSIYKAAEDNKTDRTTLSTYVNRLKANTTSD
ncbi:hypothetical protein HHI36_001035, partial [Cryptolaemus montrouzieri]